MNPKLLFAIEELLAKVGPRAAALTHETEKAAAVQPRLGPSKPEPFQVGLFSHRDLERPKPTALRTIEDLLARRPVDDGPWMPTGMENPNLRELLPKPPQHASFQRTVMPDTADEFQPRFPGLDDDVRGNPLFDLPPQPRAEKPGRVRNPVQDWLPLFSSEYAATAESAKFAKKLNARDQLPYLPEGWDGPAEPGLHFSAELEEPTGEFLRGPIGRAARPGFFPGATASIEPVMRPSGRVARWDSGPDAGSESYDFPGRHVADPRPRGQDDPSAYEMFDKDVHPTTEGETLRNRPLNRPWHEDRGPGIGKVRVARDRYGYAEKQKAKGAVAAQTPEDAIPTKIEAVAPEPVPFTGAPDGLDLSILEKLKLPGKRRKDTPVSIPGIRSKEAASLVAPLRRRLADSTLEGERTTSFDPDFTRTDMARMLKSIRQTARKLRGVRKANPIANPRQRADVAGESTELLQREIEDAVESKAVPLSPPDQRDLRVKDPDAFKFRNDDNEPGQYGKKSKALIGGDVVSDDAYANAKPGTVPDAFTNIKSGRVTSQMLPMSKVKHLKAGETYILQSGGDSIPVTVQKIRQPQELKDQTRLQDRETGHRTGINQKSVHYKVAASSAKDPMVEVIFAPFGPQNTTLKVGAGTSKAREIPASLNKAARQSDLDMQNASKGPSGKVDTDIRATPGSVPNIAMTHWQTLKTHNPALFALLKKEGITEVEPGAGDSSRTQIQYSAYSSKTGKGYRITLNRNDPEAKAAYRPMSTDQLETDLQKRKDRNKASREALQALSNISTANALMRRVREKK